MRHAKGNVRLAKATDQRLSLLRSLVEALFINGKIKTTLKRARQASRIADNVISNLRKGDLSSKKKVFAILRDKTVRGKLNALQLSRFEGKNGGYTRIIKLGTRKGDAAPLVLLEIV